MWWVVVNCLQIYFPMFMFVHNIDPHRKGDGRHTNKMIQWLGCGGNLLWLLVISSTVLGLNRYLYWSINAIQFLKQKNPATNDQITFMVEVKTISQTFFIKLIVNLFMVFICKIKIFFTEKITFPSLWLFIYDTTNTISQFIVSLTALLKASLGHLLNLKKSHIWLNNCL